MKNKLLCIIVAIIIIIGVVLGLTKGFNFGVNYGSNEKVQIYLNQTIKTADIKEIANDVFNNEPIRVQTVELFNDMASITVKSTTDEQIEKLVQRINEKYNLEYTKDDITIIKVPATSMMAIIDSYILPFILIILVSSLYIGIRYWKLGFIKMFFATIFTMVVSEAFLASLYIIIQIPVNEIMMPVALLVLGVSVLGIQISSNKKEENLKAEELKVEEE